MIKKMSKTEYGRNFIKPLPEGHDAAIDESLLWLQIRVRKGSGYEKTVRAFIDRELIKKTSLCADGEI